MVTDEEIAAALAALRRGEVVAYPTETFYGLGVDALDPRALAALARLKGRQATKALSVLVADARMAASLAAEISPRARALMAAHWPGPLTIALPARGDLPPALVADGFVAVRVSPHPLAMRLVTGLGGPLTATSANPAGEPPAATAAQAAGYFPTGCLVVDGGATAGGLASTLVRVRGDEVEVLRPGPVQIG